MTVLPDPARRERIRAELQAAVDRGASPTELGRIALEVYRGGSADDHPTPTERLYEIILDVANRVSSGELKPRAAAYQLRLAVRDHMKSGAR